MCASPALQNLTNEELQQATKIIVGSITVLTGVQVDADMLQVTLGTVKRFLRDNFGFLTAAEITKAFEMNSAGLLWKQIPHYNRSLNCDYIGQVLNQYRAYRNEQIPMIQDTYNRVEQRKLQAPARELTNDDRKAMVNAAYGMYRVDPKVGFIASDLLYSYLASFEIVSTEEYKEYTDMAKARLIGRLYMERTAIGHDDKRTGQKVYYNNTLAELNGKQEMTEATLSLINQAAKDIVIRNCFRKFVDLGSEAIFAN